MKPTPDVQRTKTATDPDTLLELEKICISYHNKQVVHDVSLKVKRGEVVALIGPSGAGKSSLLRTVNYLEKPSSGTIRMGDRVISAEAISRETPASETTGDGETLRREASPSIRR